jgi:hypothetical protein
MCNSPIELIILLGIVIALTLIVGAVHLLNRLGRLDFKALLSENIFPLSITFLVLIVANHHELALTLLLVILSYLFASQKKR